MKRIYSFMFAAVATFAAASCAQELDNQAPAGETVTFEASVDGAETKAVLDGKVSKWEKGDKITIHNGTKVFEFATTDEGVKANFSYTGNDFAGDKFIAVYPAGKYTADVEAKTVNAYIPTYQGAREGTYNENAILSVAYTENNSLAFKNACALLKFTVKGEKSIKAIEFYGNNSEAVTGNMLVTLNEDNTVKSVEGLETTFQEGDNTWNGMGTWVKFYSEDKANDWCFKEGVTYYAAIAPANFTKGVALNLILADDTKVEAVKKIDTAYDLKPNTILNLGELEYKAPAVENNNWGIAGTITNWADGADLAMTLEGDWYVAKNVTLEAGAAFKFRANGTWTTNRGSETTTPVAEGAEVKVVANGQDITAATPAIYDIYLSKGADKMKLVKVGDIEVEEPSDEPVASDWGIVGDLTNWAKNKDITMYSYKGMYVAYNVNFATAGAFKVRKGGDWNDAYNYGLESSGNVTAGHYYSVITSGGSGNLMVTAGTYDIWFDLAGKKVYVLEPGADPATATKGTAVLPLTDTWYLVGDFNKWTAADSKYKMTAEGSWYVFKNFKISSGKVKFVADAKWVVNRGGTWAGKDKKITLSSGGADIPVAAGTYDVYLSSDAKYAYFMTPGSVPAN